MIQLEDVTLRLGGRVLLDGATVTVPAGHRVGIVGRNGAGKTTMIGLIAGDMDCDAGSVRASAQRVGRVRQEAPGGAETPLGFVLAADTEREALLAEAETATDPERIAAVHERLAAIDAYAAEARAARILAGLGFSTEDQSRPLSGFSGGWRMRVALAAELFLVPDLLLLDEPTNHLDLEATLWLTQHLASYPGTLLLVSHDRTLLNRSVSHILHLEHRKLTLYAGGYDRFAATRAERRRLQAAEAKKQESARKHMQAFVDRFRYKASKARQAQSRLKALARMSEIAVPTDDPAARLELPEPQTLPPPLLTCQDATVGYEPGKPILKRLNLRIDPDDRIALLGANGNGKSTFAKLVAGDLVAESGSVTRAGKLTVGHFAQHQLEALDPKATPIQHIHREWPDALPLKLRQHLGRFGIGQELADRPAETLSGGERARLALACIGCHKPGLLVLDEPTNHLDIEAREALVTALNDYNGAVLIISHDRHLLELVAERLWLVEDGTIQAYDDDLDSYEKRLLRGKTVEEPGRGDTPGSEPVAQGDKRDQRRRSADRRRELAPLSKRVKEAEKRMASLTKARERIAAQLADPALYNGNSGQVVALNKQRAETEAALAETEAEWLEAAEALEEAQSA